MRKNVILALAGATFLAAAGVVAYIKREAIKEITEDMKECLKKKLAKFKTSEALATES